jgi:hypothetical protein
MDVYLTIYRGDTAETEIEINIEGHYSKDDNSLEILKVVNSDDDDAIELTPEERKMVATEEFDEWLESQSFFDSSLWDQIGTDRDVYWVENEATVVEVEEYETISERIVRAQNTHAIEVGEQQ